MVIGEAIGFMRGLSDKSKAKAVSTHTRAQTRALRGFDEDNLTNWHGLILLKRQI